jgi:2'-5' RNA ligase
MKAALALLADIAAHNLVRQLAWSAHQKYRIGVRASRIPPHVSLKQPFAVSDLPALEAYLGELAASVAPLPLLLPRLEIVPTTVDGQATGIFWLAVDETARLRQLHIRICDDLMARLGNTQAPFDGPDYRFHMTIALGAQPLSVYSEMFEELPGTMVNLNFTAHELALFLYDEDDKTITDYMTYKILELTGKDGE